MYLWPSSTRLVISDIDGTITTSKFKAWLDHCAGKDCSRAGVVKLYNLIHENGYKLLYLSSRPRFLADSTTLYLSQLIQDQLQLPQGPVLISPSMKEADPEVGDATLL